MKEKRSQQVRYREVNQRGLTPILCKRALSNRHFSNRILHSHLEGCTRPCSQTDDKEEMKMSKTSPCLTQI